MLLLRAVFSSSVSSLMAYRSHRCCHCCCRSSNSWSSLRWGRHRQLPQLPSPGDGASTDGRSGHEKACIRLSRPWVSWILPFPSLENDDPHLTRRFAADSCRYLGRRCRALPSGMFFWRLLIITLRHVQHLQEHVTGSMTMNAQASRSMRFSIAIIMVLLRLLDAASFSQKSTIKYFAG